MPAWLIPTPTHTVDASAGRAPAPAGPAGPADGALVLQLLLADGRFPGGGFAHSGGLEPAVEHGAVHDVASLRSFLVGRLHHGGGLEAWLAAAACRAGIDADALATLEMEAEAHQPSPALRDAWRTQGRGLRRSASLLWPALVPLRCEVQPVVLGAVASAAGVDPAGAARLAVYGVAMTVASAAAKLAALDMADALAVVAGLSGDIESIAADGASSPVASARSAPLTELRAEDHRAWEVRLFAS